MTSRQGTLLHMDGLEACMQRNWHNALTIFKQIELPSAAILYNIGTCHMQLQEYEDAAMVFQECVLKDKYCAIAYFQLASALTHLNKFDQAIEKFTACMEALRGNPHIDYRQLGMKHKFYACEAKINIALVYLFDGNLRKAQTCLEEAVTMPRDENKHFYINTALDALIDENWDYFDDSPLHRFVHLPCSCLFYPSKAKMDGLKSKSKFMDSAQVVSATDDTYSFVGFVGPVKLQKGRQSDNDGSATPTPKVSATPPPLPTVAPPRQMYKTPARQMANQTQPSNASIPVFPPVPSKPPPVLAPKQSSTSVYPPKSPVLRDLKAIPDDANNSKSTKASIIDTAAKLSKMIESKPVLKPVRRPPPPSKESLNSNLYCNVKLKVKIPKNKANMYVDFIELLSDNLVNLSKALRLDSENVAVHAQVKKEGSSTLVNEATWRNIFLTAARNKSLDISIETLTATNQVSNARPPATKKFLPASPLPNEEVYIDAVHAQEDSVYVGGVHAEDEDAVYSTTVVPGYRT